jgi:hypothetical protein
MSDNQRGLRLPKWLRCNHLVNPSYFVDAETTRCELPRGHEGLHNSDRRMLLLYLSPNPRYIPEWLLRRIRPLFGIEP